MSYSIEMSQNPIFGKHYDITLRNGTKLSFERELSLSRGVRLICEHMDDFPLGQDMVISQSHNTDKLIAKWNQSHKLIQHDGAIAAPKAPILIAEMILISVELKTAGYSLDENGSWYHLSKVN